MSKGHINDATIPGVYGCNDSLEFFREALQLDETEVLLKFEQWSCSRTKSKSNHSLCPAVSYGQLVEGSVGDGLVKVRKTVCALIANGLCESFIPLFTNLNSLCLISGAATGLKNINMNYSDYRRAIVEKLHAKLVGWLSNVPFANPSDIAKINLLKILQKALEEGECKWVLLNRREQKFADELERLKMAGEDIGPTRKTRKDKGKKRGREDEEDDDDDRGKKKARKGKGTQRKKRSRCEDDKDDNGEEEEDDDDDDGGEEDDEDDDEDDEDEDKEHGRPRKRSVGEKRKRQTSDEGGNEARKRRKGSAANAEEKMEAAAAKKEAKAAVKTAAAAVKTAAAAEKKVAAAEKKTVARKKVAAAKKLAAVVLPAGATAAPKSKQPATVCTAARKAKKSAQMVADSGDEAT